MTEMKTFGVLLAMTVLCTTSNCVYFTMEDIEVTIPDDKRKFPPREKPLMTLQAVEDTNGQIQHTHLNYSLIGPELLYINSSNGELKFSKAFYQRTNQGALELAASVTAFRNGIDAAQTTVRIEVDPTEWFDCDLLTKELCFWKSVTYKLYENREPTILGSMSSPFLADMCSTHKMKYTLLNGSSHITIEKSTKHSGQWDLHTLKSFERDIMRSIHTNKHATFGTGAKIYVGVRCAISTPGGTERDIEETLAITILDENDNAPKAQFQDTVMDVYVKDGNALKDQLKQLYHLIFTDRDSVNVNNYTVKLLGDSLKLFKVNYSILEDDREGEPQTAIHCKIFAAKNAEIPDPTYKVILQINDTTLLPGYGDSTANLTIIFHTNASTFRPKPMPPPANMKHNQLLYHHEVTIFRHAAPFARVTQPDAQILNKQSNVKRFSLKYDSSKGNKDKGAFNVTVNGGIVYVQDVEVLKKATSPVTLEVQWKDKVGVASDTLYVFITQESNSSNCKKKSDSFIEWQHCADFTSYKACTEACGLATGGNSSTTNYKTGGHTKCAWRGDKKPGLQPTKLYSTCTPDIDTCPDGICDPLEELFYLICPQDCSDDVKWFAERNKATGRGISSGHGICKCDMHGKCTCGTHSSSSGNGKKKTTTPHVTTEIIPAITLLSTVADLTAEETNATAHRVIDRFIGADQCGTKCLIGVGAGSLFLLGAITTIVVCWRANHNGKNNRRERKYVDSVNSLSGLNPDYVDRTIHSTDTITLNFDMNTSLVQATAPKIMPVDPKWEFPRENLFIEQTLGEGEFGRVLRAKALEILGIAGYTTVAVKTLKEDAREGELADLMSEYQLLKDVSHPNVIRLLGASTLPGGPVYLIIEFAEHGSLRNYLRRSRHVESEGQTPCSSALLGANENEPLQTAACIIKPRDILSFAWQISRGMSYLSDMKLVHRDLAARNVLLAAGMICKISDFGLTRDVYEDDTYLKRTKGRVPVKWMAPESLADHIYNSKSDVWSFGIILWELVTLGASPYPGIAVQNLYHLLKSGYRMERPDNCSHVLYKIMRICWSDEPGERPSFRTLTLKMESMLADGVEYLDLNPKVVHNRTYFCGLPNDLTTPDDNEDTNLTEKINYSSPKPIQKCAEADKLQQLWKRPESPKPVNARSYENEESAQELRNYESPIKFKQPSFEITHKNNTPNAYLDMAGRSTMNCNTISSCRNNTNESVSKITTL